MSPAKSAGCVWLRLDSVCGGKVGSGGISSSCPAEVPAPAMLVAAGRRVDVRVRGEGMCVRVSGNGSIGGPREAPTLLIWQATQNWRRCGINHA